LRILHTADWHVGRGIRGRSRAGEHAAVLAEIVTLTREREVELVLVAGDLFDTFAPSPEAERIVYRTLLDLSATGAQVVVIAGNHDSPARLSAVAPLLKQIGVLCLTQLARADKGGLATVTTAKGETARIALVPFVSQRGIVRADHLMDPAREASDHVRLYDEYYRVLMAELCAGFGDDTVNLVMAHAMVAGGDLGGGERTAYTGSDYTVDGRAFPLHAHYVALGHVHKCQRVNAPCPAVWYSGSPLRLDFGEESDQPCAVLVVEAVAGVPARVETVPLKSGRGLRTVYGSVASLAKRVAEFGEDYLRAVLETPGRAGIVEEVRAALPNVVDVVVAPAEGEAAARSVGPADRWREQPETLFGEYAGQAQLDDPRLLALFRDLLEAELEPPATEGEGVLGDGVDGDGAAGEGSSAASGAADSDAPGDGADSDAPGDGADDGADSDAPGDGADDAADYDAVA
jgi:DNA repair protein SbcD/Mre11